MRIATLVVLAVILARTSEVCRLAYATMAGFDQPPKFAAGRFSLAFDPRILHGPASTGPEDRLPVRRGQQSLVFLTDLDICRHQYPRMRGPL